MTPQELAAGIALTNNGYIFAPNGHELTCARNHPDLFAIRGGAIFKASDNRTFTPINTGKPKHITQRVDCDFDYEGAILARQEQYMMDY